MDYETIVFTIISESGEAKSLCMEAIDFAKQGAFDKAEQCIEEAERKLASVHLKQTSLIQSEAQGNRIEISLLLIHAQDHLMNAGILKDLGREFIELYRNMKK